MKILAIETSCDDTAVAIVEDGREVLASVISSQVDVHAITGGVVPEVAAREHLLHIMPVLDLCMKEAGCEWSDIDSLAVTQGPGLVSSLIIGTETASVISFVKGIPLIPVQHIMGHIYSTWLLNKNLPQFPILILTVSGGHNDLVLMRDYHDFELLGETLDDAAGEAFDKVARLLGLSYPGGPVISKLALDGDANKFALPRAWMGKDNLNFSFSGLKTAVLDFVRNYDGEINEQFKADLAASFQEAVVDVLSGKLMKALDKFDDIKEVHLVGGVSANTRLREIIQERLDDLNDDVIFRFPQNITYCTDNAAMIGAAAYFLYKSGDVDLKVRNVVPDSGISL